MQQAAGSRLLAKSFPSKPLEPPPALAPDCTLTLVTLKILSTDQLVDKAARRKDPFREMRRDVIWRLAQARNPPK